VVGGAIPLNNTDLTNLGGKNETALKTGVDVGGRYLYHTSPEWAFGGEVSYAGFGDKEHTVTDSVFKMSGSALDVEGVAKYTLTPKEKTRPYLIGGLGYGSLKQKTQCKPTNGWYWGDTGTTEYRTDYDETIGGVAFSIGAGVESSLSDTITLGIEGRWKYLGAKKTIDDKLGSIKWDLPNASSVLLTAGVSYKFGK
jgi:opacity protein-like surface antigen